MLATIAWHPVIAFRRLCSHPLRRGRGWDRGVRLIEPPAGRVHARPGAGLAIAGAVALCAPWARFVAPLVLLASLWMPWFGAEPAPDVGNLAAPQLAAVLPEPDPWDVFTFIAVAVLALVALRWRWAALPAALLVGVWIVVPAGRTRTAHGRVHRARRRALGHVRASPGARRLTSAAMLSSDQVLHVARLARLELTPEEVERFGGELSKVLDHIELIGQLELEDVQPTSHVIDVENALRRRRATAVVARRDRARQRAGRRRRRFPRPEPGRVMIELTAKQAADAIRSGALDAAEYFEFYRDRAAKDPYNSYIWVAEEAPEIDTSKPFAGVPIAIKDLFCTEGIPSQAGSKILEDYRPPYSATSVKKLTTDAGGTLLGKTNQDEFAMGSSTENSAYGPTLNPWDTTRVPGGSSGGSAAVVAGGTAPWSIGTDTGGSIRQPAALTGIVGMKPTYGAISRYGMIAFASSLDQAGPFTRDVTDSAMLLSAMVGADPCDQTSLGLPEPVRIPTATDLKGIRLGVPEELSGEGIEPGVLKAFEESLELAAPARRDRRDHAPPARAARPGRVLPDRARGVQLEPRPLRRRALRLPQAGRHDAAGHVQPDA